jgi:hypothetical protein
MMNSQKVVTPAKLVIDLIGEPESRCSATVRKYWIPAFAGMTENRIL